MIKRSAPTFLSIRLWQNNGPFPLPEHCSPDIAVLTNNADIAYYITSSVEHTCMLPAPMLEETLMVIIHNFWFKKKKGSPDWMTQLVILVIKGGIMDRSQFSRISVRTFPEYKSRNRFRTCWTIYWWNNSPQLLIDNLGF